MGDSLPSVPSDRWTEEDIEMFNGHRVKYDEFVAKFNSFKLYDYTDLDYVNNRNIEDIIDLSTGNRINNICDDTTYDGVKQLIKSKVSSRLFLLPGICSHIAITAIYVPDSIDKFYMNIFGHFMSKDEFFQINNPGSIDSLENLLERAKILPDNEQMKLKKGEKYIDGILYKRYEIFKPYIDNYISHCAFIEFDDPCFIYTEIVELNDENCSIFFNKARSDYVYFSEYYDNPIFKYSNCTDSDVHSIDSRYLCINYESPYVANMHLDKEHHPQNMLHLLDICTRSVKHEPLYFPVDNDESTNDDMMP